jgi:hypothetical protein
LVVYVPKPIHECTIDIIRTAKPVFLAEEPTPLTTIVCSTIICGRTL